MRRLPRSIGAVLALSLLLGAAPLSAQVLLFVPAQAGNQLWEFGITMSTGSTFSYPTQSVNQAVVVATTPNNRFLYVGGSDGTITPFVVNSDGTLTAVGAPFVNAVNVRGLAVDPGGRFLYASDNTANIHVFSIDQSTGRPTLVTVTAAGCSQPGGLVADAGNHLFAACKGSNQVASYSINPTTGALTTIGAVASGTAPDRVAITPSGGFLYATNLLSDNISIYSVAGSGALTSVGTQATGSLPLGVAVHPNGQFLVVALFGGVANNVEVYQIAGGGTLTAAGSGQSTGTTTAGATGVAFEASGQYVYVSNAGAASVTKFNFNGSTGALSSSLNSATGAGPQFLLSASVPAAPPPIPTLSTWMLVLLAMFLSGASFLMYRRAYR